MAIRRTVAELWKFNYFFFQNGSRPPSSICCVRVWTTHEDLSLFKIWLEVIYTVRQEKVTNLFLYVTLSKINEF